MRGSVPDMSAGVDGIVGSFLGDIDIVGVGLPEASGGNLHKLGLAVQLLYGVTASVAHTGLQAAHQLVDGLARQSLVRNSALYPFGNHVFLMSVSKCLTQETTTTALSSHHTVKI